MTTIGVLHPGAMGAAVGAAARGDVVWASEGRSAATAARAEAAGIHDVGSFARLVGVSAIVLSICPPAAALDVAERVARSRFDGLYVDANAVAPATVRRIAGLLPRCVDGGIIGGPPRTPGTTRFYVAGADAPAVAELSRDRRFRPSSFREESATPLPSRWHTPAGPRAARRCC
jgi:3-hydroxyisobutyrate dehydrogenase-like beta-hydroxyacid dehydrogenase